MKKDETENSVASHCYAPFPWSVDSAAVLLGTQDGDEISDRIGNRVCQVSPLSTKMANAHLIASAPDLLEALELLVKQVTEAGWHRELTETAREAIAKARGA